jgi:hypothetical protein
MSAPVLRRMVTVPCGAIRYAIAPYIMTIRCRGTPCTRQFPKDFIPPCLSFRPSSALRQRLHSSLMRPLSRLEYERKSDTIRYRISRQPPYQWLDRSLVHWATLLGLRCRVRARWRGGRFPQARDETELQHLRAGMCFGSRFREKEATTQATLGAVPLRPVLWGRSGVFGLLGLGLRRCRLAALVDLDEIGIEL